MPAPAASRHRSIGCVRGRSHMLAAMARRSVTAAALDQAIDKLGLAEPASRARRGLDVSVPPSGPSRSRGQAGDHHAGIARSRDSAESAIACCSGRGEEADVRIDSVFVSRYHALIVRDNGQDLMLDLGSTNGLLVNSRRILRRALRHRDLIQVGPARVMYLNEQAMTQRSISIRARRSASRGQASPRPRAKRVPARCSPSAASTTSA